MNRFYWNQYEYLALQHSNWLLSYLKQRFLRSLSCSCTTSYNMNIGVVMLVKSIWPENASQSQTTCCVYLDILLLHYTGCNCRNKLKSCLNFVVFPSHTVFEARSHIFFFYLHSFQWTILYTTVQCTVILSTTVPLHCTVQSELCKYSTTSRGNVIFL